jgi:hypothetical protein
MGKVGFQFDFYLGIGLQYYKRYITVYQERNTGSYDWETLNPPRTEKLAGFLPTLNTGMLISVPFIKTH